jgi:5-(carboxyamino)imidazole ribonucleotide mutase
MGNIAVIIMGSESDRSHATKISGALDDLGIGSEIHVASAHKQPLEVLRILGLHETDAVVYITIAGRSNALSGFVAANSRFPTIACPPFTDKLDMLVNIHSTLQMPSKVPVMTVLEPVNAALAVQRIFDLIGTGSEQCAE